MCGINLSFDFRMNLLYRGGIHYWYPCCIVCTFCLAIYLNAFSNSFFHPSMIRYMIMYSSIDFTIMVYSVRITSFDICAMNLTFESKMDLRHLGGINCYWHPCHMAYTFRISVCLNVLSNSFFPKSSIQGYFLMYSSNAFIIKAYSVRIDEITHAIARITGTHFVILSMAYIIRTTISFIVQCVDF